MQVAIEKKEGAEISFKVEIPQEKVEAELSQAFYRLVKDVQIPGFRKGNIPRKIFEKRFGEEALQEEAIKKIYPEVYREIVKEHNLIPIVEPTVEIIQFSGNKPLIFKINLVNRPEVKLGKYKGIRVKKRKIEVSTDEIETVLKQFQKQHTNYIPLKKEREVRQGDWVVLDYQIFHEKRLLPRGTQKNFFFKVGSSLLPPSFSEGLMGLKKGERKELEIQFSSSYPQKDFAGKKIMFKITLKEIREEKAPPLDDKFAKNLKFDSLENFKKHIQEQLKETKENWEEKRLKREIIDKVVETSHINIPPSLVKRRVEERIKELEDRLKKEGSTLQSYLEKEKLSEKELKARLNQEIEKGISTFFILEAIAEQEEIKVEEKEIEERLKSSTTREIKEAELNRMKNNLAARGELNTVTAHIREEKVIDFLYKEAKMSE